MFPYSSKETPSPPSPSKPTAQFPASIKFQCAKSIPIPAKHSRNNRNNIGKQPLLDFEEVDLFAPDPSCTSDNVKYYIFNPTKYPIKINDKTEIKTVRQNLVKDIKDAALKQGQEYFIASTELVSTKQEESSGLLLYKTVIMCPRSRVYNKKNNKSPSLSLISQD